MNDTCTCSSHNFAQINLNTINLNTILVKGISNGLLDNMAVTPRMWWLDVACSNHLMLAVELYEKLPSARQKVRATHSSTHPWPAPVHAVTVKSSLSWPPQQFDAGVKFVPCIAHTNTDTFTHTKAFTHRRFKTQTLLHTDAFIRRRFYTQTRLHTDAFTHRRFNTQTLLHTNTLTHRHFYTQTLLHTDAFVYTQTLLHTDTFAHRRFYTQTL